jgi:predicted nucleic acid-binding protein
MNGNKGLIDSNVIIDATKGKISIEEILKEYDFLYVSIISYVEVLGFKFESESEKSAIHELFREIEIVNLEKGIADIAIEI